MAKRTTQMLAELETLAKSARENIWKRIGLAKQVLADHDWIATAHNGSELKARDAIQDQYFYELNGTYTLGVLLSIYGAFPNQKDWIAAKYNLQTMRARWEEAKVKDDNDKPNRKGPIPRREFEELQQRMEAQTARCEALAEENARLRAEIAQLREQNAILQGRLMERAA